MHLGRADHLIKKTNTNTPIISEALRACLVGEVVSTKRKWKRTKGICSVPVVGVLFFNLAIHEG